MCVSNAFAVQPKELGNYFIQLFLVLIALSMRKAQGRLHTKTIAATLRQSGKPFGVWHKRTLAPSNSFIV
jgi:hypothetical protein